MMTKNDVARLIKETVAACATSEELERFMSGYMAGAVAEHFVDQMVAPGQRAMWVKNMREKYPTDFASTGQA
jgi:hypothetical protein